VGIQKNKTPSSTIHPSQQSGPLRMSSKTRRGQKTSSRPGASLSSISESMGYLQSRWRIMFFFACRITWSIMVNHLIFPVKIALLSFKGSFFRQIPAPLWDGQIQDMNDCCQAIRQLGPCWASTLKWMTCSKYVQKWGKPQQNPSIGVSKPQK
jgi:hypothetical protein